MLQLSERDIDNPDVLGEKLIQLAEIIIRKHFYASYKDRDDLVQVGVLKALTMVHDGKWEKSKGTFLNFIYTGMRNDIHNYLYHQDKFPIVDPDNVKEEGADDQYFEDDTCPIEYSLVHSVCMKFFEAFGEGIEDLVIQEMEEIGYTIRGRAKETQFPSCYSSIVQERYDKAMEEDIIGRIIGLILWKKKERDS